LLFSLSLQFQFCIFVISSLQNVSSSLSSLVVCFLKNSFMSARLTCSSCFVLVLLHGSRAFYIFAVEYILRIQARISFPCLRIEAEGKLYYGVFCQDDFVPLSGGHWIVTRLEGEKGL
jgi:hypothetical protein